MAFAQYRRNPRLVYARAEPTHVSRVERTALCACDATTPALHLERQTGAINQTLENGLQGYQMLLHHLVFTVLPVTAQLATIIVILLRFHQPVFLAIFCAALLCYA